MTPAERLAALRALQDGIARAVDLAKADVLNAMKHTGADRFRTELGPVYMGKRADTIMFDEAKLLRFAEDADLDAIEKSVRPTFRELFKIDGDDVIFTPSGEVITFARVRPGTTYVAAKLSTDAKERAQALMAGRLELASAMFEQET
jgi:hypothetical protein